MDYIGKSPISLPVLVLGKIAFLASALFFLVKYIWPDSMLFDSMYTRVIGVILFAAGLLMLMASILQLGRSTAVGIPERETELKTKGMYHFSRNPIYFSAFVMCAGSCFFSVHPLNICLFAVAVAVHVRIIAKEEEFLEKRFGGQWLEYKRRVPRYIGMLLLLRILAAGISNVLAIPATSLDFRTRLAVALAVGVPSLALMIVSRRQLGAAFSYVPEAKGLVTSGLYSKIQHPMYLFVDLLFLSLIVLSGWPFLLLAWWFLVFVQAFQARREERLLTAAFGATYEKYKQQLWF